jgi:uncharacterized protein YndB with AHSA1/START domain
MSHAGPLVHVHEESFPASPERLFEALHTPSAIRAWWGAARVIVVPEVGGTWAATWGDDEDAPDYVSVSTLVEFDPPRRLVFGDYRYHAREDPLPFKADFLTSFEVEPHPDGALLRVRQAGFPDTPEGRTFLAACDAGWRATFEGLRSYLQ